MINLIAKPIRRKNNELVDTTGLSWTKKKVDSLFSSENKGNCAENNNDNSKNNSNSESKHGTIAEDAISSPNRAGTVGNSRLSKRGQSPIGKQRTAGVGGTIVGNSNNHSNSYGNNDEEIVGKLLEEVQDKSKTIEGELSVEALRFASSGAGESRTVQCGRVQFDNIPIPPDAPKDLVCEECEKEFSVFKCTACDQVFCRKCAELCHPKRYGGAFLHPHEQEECIRAVAVGDKSRITIDDTFHLPSNYFYEEDYVKVKNLTIPGSLSTNDYAKTIKPAPQITIDTNSYDNSRGLVKVVQQEKYEVNQVVVFDDPFSSKSGYGIIISEWDHRNSTESTPAILRGDNSKYYYIIQMLGCTDNFWLLDRIYNGYKDALNLMKIEKEKKIFPKIELLQDNSASSVSNSDTSKSLQLGPLLDDDYRYAYQDARLIDKRITEMQSLKLLGPKFHLRKVRYDPLITELEAASRPEKFNIDGRLPISSIERSTLSTLQQQPLLLQRQERLKAIQEQKQKEKEEIMIIRRQSSNYFGSYDEAVSEYGSISRSYSNVFNKSTDIYGNGGAIRNNNSVSIDLVNENYQRSIRNLQVGSLDEHDNYNAVGRSGNVIAKSHSAQYNNDDSGIIPNSFAYTNGEYLDSNEISNSNGNDDGVPYFVHAYQTLLASYKTDKENADEEAKANVQQVSPAHKEKEPKTKEELAAERQLALYHRSIYGDHAPEKRKLKMNSEVYELVDVNIYAGIDIDDQSQLPINHEEQEPLTANLRSYEDTVQYDVKNEIDLDRFDALSLEDGNNAVGLINTYDSVVSINGKKQIMQRSLRVLVMGESDFISLEEKVQQLKDRRIGILKALVSGTAGINDWKRVGKRFKTWKKNMKFLKKQQYHYNARKIQTTVRRWLCRNALEDKYKEIQDDLQRKWQSVHAKFRYTTADDPLAVTMDRRVYFKTKHDVNLFADTLRVMVLKVVKYLKKKQNIMLKRSLEQWKKSVGQFLESGLAVDHFNDVAIDTDTDRKFVRNSVEYEKDVLSEHEKILTQFQPYMSVPSVARVATPAKSSEEKGSRIIRRDTIDLPINNEIQIHISAPSNDGYDESVVSPAIKPIDSKYIDESSYESVMNLPMRIPRDQSNVLNDHLTSEKKLSFNDVPSYLPSKDIQNLPELLPIYDPMTADGRLYIKNDRRLEYCSYRKVMQGPTDSCSWVIPNRLLMGSIPIEDVPTGQGKTTIPAVSLLMLAGIDIFISLMEEDEETKYIKDLDKTPIEQYISTSLTKANAIVNQIIIENHEVINKQLEKLASVPEYGKTDPRYAKAYRERLRYKARIRLAHDIINRTKVQFKKLPSKVCWYRISNLSTSSTPNINELLPHLWRMENELKYYHNIFIYSKEGHGRVGMIGALLLGRIYELHPYESLYRVQLSHDSSTREAQREQVITCPQLPVQRKLVVDALLLSSRILSQPNVRTQLNPDTYIDHKRVRDVMSMTRLSKEKKSEKFKEKKEEIAESLKDEYLQLVKTMDKRLLKLPALASPRSVKRFLKGGNLSQQDEEEDPLEKKFREYAALYDELDDHTDYDVHNEEFQRAENKRQKHSLRLDHLLVMPKDSKINDHLKFSYSSKSRQSSFSGGASRSGISRTSSRATDRSFQRKMRGSRTSRDSFDSVLNENYLRRVGTVIEEDESLASGKVEGDLSFKPAKENKDGRETVSGVRSNTSSRPTSGSMISRIRKSFGSLVDLVDQSFSTQSKENSENESSDRPSSRHSHHSMHEERTIMLEKMGSVDGQESFHSITIPSNHPIVVAAKSRDSDRPSRRFKRIPSPKVRGEVSTIATEIAEKLAKARDSKDHSSESEHSYSSRKYTRRETSSKLNRKHRRNSRGSRGSRDSFDSQKRAPLTESQFSSLMINPTEVSSVAQNNKTNKMVREAALAASAPSLTELYGSVGQMKDIVRTLPVRRHIPAEDAKLPLIRQRITRPRSKSPARSPIRRSSSVK